jgi:hypothetical protein
MPSSYAAACLAAILVVAPYSASALGRAATAAAQDAKKGTSTPSTVTLIGCVSGKPLATGEFTFVDNVTGSKYRLNGKGMKKYAGQQVEVVSGPARKLAVKGGLYPSPNIAAQAGALDPAQEAIARQPGGAASGTAGTELPEFRVGRIRVKPGACQ